MKLFKDILKERSKYSQGRVYLLWSVVAYYITLGILLVGGMSNKQDLDVNKFEIIIQALEYAMVLFGGYVFGGKFLDVVKIVGSKKIEDKKSVE